MIEDGDAAFESEDWDMAISDYEAVLELRPNAEDIRARLEEAKRRRQIEITAGINDNFTRQLDQTQKRIENITQGAALDKIQKHTEAESVNQQLDLIYDNLQRQAANASLQANAGNDSTKPPHQALLTPAVASNSQPIYPILLGPVPANSPPVKVLTKLQPKIRNIDKEIHDAQEALRRLVDSNSNDNEEREAWVKESEEATLDAQKLSLDLLFDLIGERVDEQAELNGEKQTLVFERLKAELDGGVPSKRIVSRYETLRASGRDLERIQQEIRLGGKLNDLNEKITNFSIYKSESNLETIWDVMSQFKKVEELTGPWEHLLNAGYTIYRQASSIQRMSVFRANNEKTYQASKTLGLLIQKLVAEKKAEEARRKP
jgi:hypothetical protein